MTGAPCPTLPSGSTAELPAASSAPWVSVLFLVAFAGASGAVPGAGPLPTCDGPRGCCCHHPSNFPGRQRRTERLRNLLLITQPVGGRAEAGPRQLAPACSRDCPAPLLAPQPDSRPPPTPLRPQPPSRGGWSWVGQAGAIPGFRGGIAAWVCMCVCVRVCPWVWRVLTLTPALQGGKLRK